MNLPSLVIWAIKFNTSGYGDAPIDPTHGTPCGLVNNNCGYDSLNVGLSTQPGAPFAGTDVDATSVMLRGAKASSYCSVPAFGVDVLQNVLGCWGGQRPMARIVTKPGTYTPITTKVDRFSISPTDYMKWSTWNESTDTPNAATFVTGPATPPAGQGSLELSVPNSTTGNSVRTPQFSHLNPVHPTTDTLLSSIQTLSYSTYPVGGTVVPALSFDVNFAGEAGYSGRLVYEPVYDPDATVTANAWNTFDVLNGQFWASPSAQAKNGGRCQPTGQGPDPLVNSCSMAQILQLWPNAKISGNLAIQLGSGVTTAPTTANVDNVKVGVADVVTGNITETTFDFENPTAPEAPTNVAATAGTASATVTFVAPASDGGSAITGYTAAPTAGPGTCTVTGLTATCTGLVNGSAVTISVNAVNAVGSSAAAVSNSVTPSLPPSVLDYTPVGPKRLFDTRPGQGLASLRSVAKQKVSGGYELKVKVTDLAGFVPATGVGAVSLNLTATEGEGVGFVTAYACGTRELVSSVNFVAGNNVANAVIAPVSAAGEVCFYSNVPVHLVADINGWFAADRAFVGVGPKRVFDTRADESLDALRAVPKAKINARSMLEIKLTDLAGYVPATGVGTVSLNVTVANPAAIGFITVYDCGTRELVSSVNYAAGQTVANAVIAPVSATGTVCFYSSQTTDLIVDVNGWLKTGSGFTGVTPKRVLDTRFGESPDALRTVAKTKIGGATVLQVRVTDLPGVVPASGVGAVSLNVTATNPEADSFITVYACGTREEVSSVNFATGQNVANAVITPVSATGTICIYSLVPTDVVVDVNGCSPASPPPEATAVQRERRAVGLSGRGH